MKFALPSARFSSPHGRHSAATGFVFLCEQTQEPRAFVNRCPHARLELDLDDSDFFAEGFLQCKAHGAFFDPRPTGTRRRAQTTTNTGALPRLRVWVEDGNVVVSDGEVADRVEDSAELAEYP
ncbi:hypothetical protein P43SY_007943 [Pythium insidiosum]|uniref:Rieske domain-containing protein n=1 Tax=Pythium insidiosum TaxID=114742 RepID=A0AAD5LAR2_PYTIN|nr:hypothetical protein P43SY_007943 [Pythium insidiosum]